MERQALTLEHLSGAGRTVLAGAAAGGVMPAGGRAAEPDGAGPHPTERQCHREKGTVLEQESLPFLAVGTPHTARKGDVTVTLKQESLPFLAALPQVDRVAFLEPIEDPRVCHMPSRPRGQSLEELAPKRHCEQVQVAGAAAAVAAAAVAAATHVDGAQCTCGHELAHSS